jgi:hypothetical protein
MVTSQLVIPRTVTRVEGSWSSVNLSFKSSDSARSSVFSVASRDQSLLFRRFSFENSNGRAKTLILHASEGTLLAQDIAAGGIKLLERSSTGGEVFLENITTSGIAVAGSAGVWIRQFNTEGSGVRITNTGAPLWILGSKTEQNMTLLLNSDGARTELMGGFVYMVHFKEPQRPYLMNRNGQISASLAEEAFFPYAAYGVFLDSAIGDRQTEIRATDLPVRHHSGRIAPQIFTDP